MKNVARKSRHGKPCIPSVRKDDWTLDAKAIRRGVTARQLLQKGLPTLRQARKMLQSVEASNNVHVGGGRFVISSAAA